MLKKIFNWQVILALVLVALSLGFYTLDYLLFGDLRNIIFYGLIDVAFLFLSVLIVTLFLHRLLDYREKQAKLKKLNMVIGTFFGEAGTGLLEECSKFLPDLKLLSAKLLINKEWTQKEFLAVRKELEKFEINVDSKKGDLEVLKKYLLGKRSFMLALLENPNLLEHESFTELLWAVFHLTDELAHRKSTKKLPANDYQHLSGDIKRAYKELILQWLDYMNHLRQAYPYLYSLAMRTNPFDEKARVELE